MPRPEGDERVEAPAPAHFTSARIALRAGRRAVPPGCPDGARRPRRSTTPGPVDDEPRAVREGDRPRVGRGSLRLLVHALGTPGASTCFQRTVELAATFWRASALGGCDAACGETNAAEPGRRREGGATTTTRHGTPPSGSAGEYSPRTGLPTRDARFSSPVPRRSLLPSLPPTPEQGRPMRGKRFVQGLTLCFVLVPLAAFPPTAGRPSIVHYDLRLDLDVAGESCPARDGHRPGHGRDGTPSPWTWETGDRLRGRGRSGWPSTWPTTAERPPAGFDVRESKRTREREVPRAAEARTPLLRGPATGVHGVFDEPVGSGRRCSGREGDAASPPTVPTDCGRSLGKRWDAAPVAGRIEYEWVPRKPLPTYVFGFVVGPFTARRDEAVRLVYRDPLRAGCAPLRRPDRWSSSR